ncbi:MAG TPA: SulP family inorganic anion transporter [bacterium]|nr:SulP family inorganic anion transporter [bacterium]
MLYPKLFTTLKKYSFRNFSSDFMAGVIVGIVALPLAIAFAIASGVSPEKGLITAIVAGFMISVLGGSRVQIGGPTGAFVVIVYGIVQQHGMDGLILATFLAGFLLMAMGAAGLGNVIKFIPHPVVIGFTSGIAVIIFSSEMKDFLGLSIQNLPADFIRKWAAIFENIRTVNPYAVAIALATVLIIAYWPRISRKIPGSVIALILSVLMVKMFHWPVETIGTKFGDLPATLPMPRLPSINFWKIQDIIQPAITIALLGAIESLLSAVVSDGMIGGRHRSNMELMAQGAANIGSALFGGIPATGAIARTVTNIKNGGRTPVAGIVHALTLLIIVLFLGRWAKLIPLACLAGILVVVAYNMSEWRSFLVDLRGLRGSAAVLVITFAMTILFDLTIAIEIGMILSLFLFMHRMVRVTKIRLIDEDQEVVEEETEDINKIKVPAGVDVYEINGPFFFGIAHEFEEAVRTVADMPKARILRLRHVPIIDSTGIQALKAFYKKCQASHIRLMISGLQPQPLEALKKAGLYDLIGQENFFKSIEQAIEHVSNVLQTSK